MRTVILLIILFLPAQVLPQSVKARGVKNVSPGSGVPYLLAGVVPGSGNLLLAGEGYNGLFLLDARSGSVTVISSDAGAGYEPSATADGRKIFYRSDFFSDNRKYSSIRCYDISTGKDEVILGKGRDVIPPAVAGNTVLLVSEGEAKTVQAGPMLKSGNNTSFVVIEEMFPVLWRGGEKKRLKPNGDGFYIWASLSPDGTKILYNYQGRGSFICDTEGRILHDLGRINAPKWFSDRLVIGMDDKDDGHRITSSELIFYSLGDKTGNAITATPERSEMFPVAAGRRKIAFCTDKGEVYIMKVRVR
jgi:Tol biopolymer transport system component